MKKRIMQKLHKLACDWTTAEGLLCLVGRLTPRQDWLLKRKHRSEYLRFLCKERVKISFD